MPHDAYVAFDLGAESGRAMLLTLEEGRAVMREAHRFPNLPQELPSGLHWNLQALWEQIVTGLREAGALAREAGLQLKSVGVDTWGVDYGLLGQSGQLLGLPFAYRDARNPPAMQKAIDKLGEAAIYEATGIQFMPLNTLYQLIAQRDAEPGPLQHADRLLNTPDLLGYFLSGRRVHEATIASTTQMVDPRTGRWARELLERLELPTHMLGEIVPAGTVIGRLRAPVARAAGIEPIDVVATAGHDTAAAVAAVPAEADADWAYLSSGTWSLMGAEVDEPVVNEASREAGFTNERGVGGKIRFLKNISGLWLVQECRRDLEEAGTSYDYDELTRLAGEAEPFRTLVDPDHPPFAEPGAMREKIADFARASGQPAPETPGQFVRTCLESLALRYRSTLDGLESILGRRFSRLHVVGGGGKNELLNQMTADAIDRPIIVGPYEGTAMGNGLVQAMAGGALEDLAAIRRTVAASVRPTTVEPEQPGAFAAERERFDRLSG